MKGQQNGRADSILISDGVDIVCVSAVETTFAPDDSELYFIVDVQDELSTLSTVGGVHARFYINLQIQHILLRGSKLLQPLLDKLRHLKNAITKSWVATGFLCP
jgi:hypothetical protein